MRTKLLEVFFLSFVLGCGSSQQFIAVPPEINREAVPKQTVAITAERFHFIPEEIHVKQGTLVTLQIRAVDGTHGFNLGAFGIDERIKDNETKAVEFYAGQKGIFSFRCSHFCGIGHLGMTGKIIIE